MKAIVLSSGGVDSTFAERAETARRLLPRMVLLTLRYKWKLYEIRPA